VVSNPLKQNTLQPAGSAKPAGFLFLERSFEEEHKVNIDFGKSGGLVPAIIQDEESGEVLMLGFMNDAAFEETLHSGEVVFFSRSRNKRWKKGESSGHILRVRDIRIDCDLDALLVRVQPVGPGVCHEGYRSCFFRSLNHKGAPRVVAERTFEPESVYKTSAQNSFAGEK